MDSSFAPGRVRALVCVLSSTVVLAMAPTQVSAQHDGWLVQFGTVAVDSANGVAVDGRDVYVAGATSGTFPGEVSAGGQDVYVRSYTSDGQLQWTRQFGTPGADGPGGGVRARGGRVVVAGFVRGALPGQLWAGADDAFVVEFGREGDIVWTVQFGTPQNERVRSVALADDGSIFISGNTTGQLTEAPSEGSTDAFVARLNADGTIRWLRQFGTAGSDEAIGIAISRNAIYVSGATSGAFPGQASSGDFDNFAIRMTLDGEMEWITQFGTTAFDALWKISVVGRTVFVGGNTQGEFSGELLSGGFDAVAAALDRQGRVRWVHQFGTTGNDLALGLAADNRGMVAVGRIGGFLPPGGPDPESNAFAYSYDAAGNLQWMAEFGTNASDNATDVSLEDEDVYVVGNTTGSFPGSVNAGLQDGYVMRIHWDKANSGR